MGGTYYLTYNNSPGSRLQLWDYGQDGQAPHDLLVNGGPWITREKLGWVARDCARTIHVDDARSAGHWKKRWGPQGAVQSAENVLDCPRLLDVIDDFRICPRSLAGRIITLLYSAAYTLRR